MILFQAKIATTYKIYLGLTVTKFNFEEEHEEKFET